MSKDARTSLVNTICLLILDGSLVLAHRVLVDALGMSGHPGNLDSSADCGDHHPGIPLPTVVCRELASLPEVCAYAPLGAIVICDDCVA
jgi:hypothetical protein